MAPPPVAFRLLGITDRRLLDGTALDDWLAVLCWHGLRGVQLREKDLEPQALERLAMTCRPVFERHHLQWFVNGDPALARRVEATGVHLPADGNPGLARAILGPDRLIGQSVHARDEAVAAVAAGADFLVAGPVWDTPAKRGLGAPLGLPAFAAICAAVRVPVFAVGGVTPERAEECRKSGARGAAAIRALMATEEPEETLAKYEAALERL